MTSSLSPGAHSITAQYAGDTNFTASASAAPLVQEIHYAWTGFFQPVDNLPTVNSVKAGQAIPVKFSLGGNQSLAIFAAGYPASTTIACGSASLEDAIEDTVTAGGSSLSYDAVSGQYVYVWKTEKSWANTCRQLVIKLKDGTYRRANFKLK